MAKRITLNDVAALAGVSPTAVSLVLNNRPGTRLSDTARDRIKAAAAELGYRPNPAARSLRMGKSHTIGLISFDVTITRYASAILRGALDEAERLDHTVLIAEAGDTPARAVRAIDAMLDRRVEGIVMAQEAARQIDVSQRVPPELPVVMVNATSSDGHASVLPDERIAGEQVTQVLIDAGHTKIALLGVREELRDLRRSATVGLRYDGIATALRAASVEPVAVSTGRSWEPEVGYEAMLSLLREGPSFTGLVCLNDRLAFGAYEAARELGIGIPQDVSIVSFDDDVLASYVRPQLTTAEIPYETMGRIAVDMVLGDAEPTHRLVPMPLRLRDSVALPRA